MSASRSTAVLLEEMPEFGVFEKLSLACLRRLSPDECGTLIHEGINAEGKPVPAPLDGFHQVPWRTPILFVGVACTTEAVTNLHKKWLGFARNPRPRKKKKKRSAAVSIVAGSSPTIDPKADIPKAVASKCELVAAFPGSSFKLFLVTNRGVSKELQLAVATALNPEGIAYEIVERSRLAEFLDTKPEGQFLREVYLGVPTIVLSRGVLYNCGIQLLSNRRHSHDLQTARDIIKREFDGALRESWNTVETTVVWLGGESGKGKSVAACSQLRSHCEQGGLVIWLTESDVAAASTLAEAIYSALARIRPSLRLDDIEDILRLPDPTQRMLVLVDDLNRSDDPARDFGKVRAWAARLAGKSGAETGATESGTVLLCPVWPRNRRRIATPNSQPASWEVLVEVGDFSPREQAAFGTKAALDQTKQSAIHTIALGDPYLTGWLAHVDLPSHGSDINVGWVVDGQVAQVADRSTGVRAPELTLALLALGAWMLRTRQLRPLWTEAIVAFGHTEHVGPLRELVKDGTVLFEADNLVAFAHDRLRDVWLARALSRVAEVPAVCGEVHYAELVGEVIAENALPLAQLDYVTQENPLALFAAWNRVNARDSSSTRVLIITKIREWLHLRNGRYDDTEWLQWEIARKLQGIDAPEVLELVDQLRSTHTLLIAGIRNGSAKAARRYLQSMLDHFPPALPDPTFESAISIALERKREAFMAELNRGLSDGSDSVEAKEAWILVAGYVGADECGQWIAVAWSRAQDSERQEWIAAMLWSSSRCQKGAAVSVWEKVFAAWQNLSAGDNGITSPRNSVVQFQLNMCSGVWLANDLVAWIKTQIVAGHILKDQLSSILSGADTPDAVEYQVRLDAQYARDNPGRKKSISGLKRLVDGRNGGKRASSASRERLSAIWQSENEAADDREAAFAQWLLGADADDLAQMQVLPTSSPLQAQAVLKRIWLRDMTCVPLVMRMLPNERWWLPKIPAIWTKQLLPVVNSMLQDYSSDRGSMWQYYAHEFFIAIPPADAEELILAHEPQFRGDANILQAAVMIGTRRLQDWVRRVVAAQPELREQIFDHIVLQINMGRSYSPRWLSKRMWLRNIEPFLDWIPDKEKERFLKDRFDSDDGWSKKHILPMMGSAVQAKYAKTEENLVEIFSRFLDVDDPTWRVRQFVEQAERNNWVPNEIVHTLVVWAKRLRDEASFVWLSAFVGEIGGRTDVATLNLLLDEVPSSRRTSAAREAEIRVFRRVLY